MFENDGYEFDARFVLEHDFPSSAVIAGVDEAGRGPLAGTVVAAAVILPSTGRIYGLRDSKVVPPEQREALYCEIMEDAIAVEISIVDPIEIDRLNILQATLSAMRSCLNLLAPQPHVALIDGHIRPRSNIREHAVVRGDSLSASIMAASIIAKVTRDHLMMEAHELYPQYGFNQHKGYGAPVHLEALRVHGPCPLHRRSFSPIKEMMGTVCPAV